MLSRRRFLQAGTITAGAGLAAFTSRAPCRGRMRSPAALDRQPEIDERSGQANHG